jgi:hypothetical protein
MCQSKRRRKSKIKLRNKIPIIRSELKRKKE